MVALAQPVKLGSQRPRLSSVPPRTPRGSAGDETIQLATEVGLILDDWQQFVLRESLGEQMNGLWQCGDVAVVCSRQNGKNAILEARLLAGLFLFGERRILHTAHEMKAAATTFVRLEQLIEGHPRLRRRVANFAHSKGGEGIELADGAELRFLARTGGSGRSFTADTLILDEAYNLPAHVMNAITPTLGARPNPQIWYTSSAVNQAEHPHGLTLARIRRRGLAGGDARLAFFEWSGDEDAFARALLERTERDFVRDPDQWAMANPALGWPARANGSGLTYEFLESQLGRLGVRGFAAEHLGIGDWPEEPADEDTELIDRGRWAELVDRLSTVAPNAARAFAVAVNDRADVAAISVAGFRADRLPHVEVVDERRGVAWVAARVRELMVHKPVAVLIDPGSPAGQLIVPIENEVRSLGGQWSSWQVTTVPAREYGQACLGFYTAVVERPDPELSSYDPDAPVGGFRHLDDSRLTYAVEQAATRPLMGSWVWDHNTGPTLVSTTLALHGLRKYGQETTTESWGFYA